MIKQSIAVILTILLSSCETLEISENDKGNLTTKLELYSFEDTISDIPYNLYIQHSAAIELSTSDAHIDNKVILDKNVFYTGESSVRLSSNENTTRWDNLWRWIDVPCDKIKISYYVKGNDIRHEGNQYRNNCFLGFQITDVNGNKTWPKINYSGTFDWKYDELILDIKNLGYNPKSILFQISNLLSGDLWVDDLKIEYLGISENYNDENNITVKREHYFFEDTLSDIPYDLKIQHSTAINLSISDFHIDNEIILDKNVFYSGESSLRLSSNTNTTRWDTLWKWIDIPCDKIKISYYVKGKDIRHEGNQYRNNCFLGFQITDNNGNKTWPNINYNGTFDWKYDELILDIKHLGYNPESILFQISNLLSGDLWIDDLKIEYLGVKNKDDLSNSLYTYSNYKIRHKENEIRQKEFIDYYLKRGEEDAILFSQSDLDYIENKYGIANSQWGTEEAINNLKELVNNEKYAGANRIGCALNYLYHLTSDENKLEYLITAKNEYSNSWWGDGTNVGAYSTYELYIHYKKIGDNVEAEKYRNEIMRKYSGYIDHRQNSFEELLNRE